MVQGMTQPIPEPRSVTKEEILSIAQRLNQVSTRRSEDLARFLHYLAFPECFADEFTREFAQYIASWVRAECDERC